MRKRERLNVHWESLGIVYPPSVEGHFRKKQTERFCVSGSLDLIDNERSAPGIDNRVYQTL